MVLRSYAAEVFNHVLVAPAVCDHLGVGSCELNDFPQQACRMDIKGDLAGSNKKDNR